VGDVEAYGGGNLERLGAGGQHRGRRAQQLVADLDPHPGVVQADAGGPAEQQPGPGLLQHGPAGRQDQRRLDLTVVGGEAGGDHGAEPRLREQPAELGPVDRPDRVAALAGVGHPPGQLPPLGRVGGEPDLAGPAQPDLAAEPAGEPWPAGHPGHRQLVPGGRVLAEGRDGRERPGRRALVGPVGVDQHRPQAAVDQVDGDRAADDAAADHDHRGISVGFHDTSPWKRGWWMRRRPESGHRSRWAHGSSGSPTGRPFGPTGASAPRPTWS
jgi:hypothetical protein